MTELSSVADFATPARDTRPGSEEGSQPRVIRQSTSLFLVAEAGELWRVYDSPAPDGVDRQIPDERTQLRYRLFLSLSGPSEIRACRLTDDCPRDVDAVSLQRQLDSSRAIGGASVTDRSLTPTATPTTRR